MSDTLAALNSGGKRTRIHDAQMVVKLPKAAKALVEAEAKREGVFDAVIVRRALGEYFERRGLGL
jgi:hypothetical protein